MNPLWILVGAGASLIVLSRYRDSMTPPHESKSGIKWTVAFAANGDSIVMAPANPPIHDKYPVIQIRKEGSSWVFVQRYPSVPADIYRAAMKDFGIVGG